MPTIVLASQSTSRRRLLEGAGITPLIKVSHVDEETDFFNAMAPADMVIALAVTKAHTVREQIDFPAIIIGCDSTFEFEGKSLGKPGSYENAIQRCKQLSGKSGLLHTGHCAIDLRSGKEVSKLSTSKVQFAQMTDEEITDYVNSGEPLNVAGGFTLDGLSAPYISSIEGEPSGIIGLSLPLLRMMIISLGYTWPELKNK